MTLVGFKAKNHPQQVGANGAADEVDDRGTPQDFWDELNGRYHFTLDVAAAPHNAKTAEYYTRADDGLAQPWHGSVWCNPPYSNLNDWLAKAWHSPSPRNFTATLSGGRPLLAVVPASRIAPEVTG